MPGVNRLIRGGYVLTMDSAGDTRWHMRNTLLRGMSDGRPAGNGLARAAA